MQAEYYHAGMTAEERRLAQQKFMSNETCVMCATTAFGMGIDKADVRLVVHWQAPKSLDAYIQASPRSHRNCFGDLHASLIAWIHLLHEMAASLIAWRPLFHHMIAFFVAWNRLISSRNESYRMPSSCHDLSYRVISPPFNW